MLRGYRRFGGRGRGCADAGIERERRRAGVQEAQHYPSFGVEVKRSLFASGLRREVRMHVAIRRLHETSGRQFVGTTESHGTIIQIRKSAKPPCGNRERHHSSGQLVNFEHVNFEQRYLRLSSPLHTVY